MTSFMEFMLSAPTSPQANKKQCKPRKPRNIPSSYNLVKHFKCCLSNVNSLTHHHVFFCPFILRFLPVAVPYQSAVECRGPEDSEGDMDYVRTASVNNPSTKQVASNNRTRRSPDELLKLGVL